MAAFNESEIAGRRDWLLLRNGAITLYFRPEILTEDVAWLREHQYSDDPHLWFDPVGARRIT